MNRSISVRHLLLGVKQGHSCVSVCQQSTISHEFTPFGFIAFGSYSGGRQTQCGNEAGSIKLG